MELKEYPYLVWLDLEMTGLDPDSERIIEIATVITSSDLEEVIEGPNLVINQPREYLDNMDEWNTSHHGNSGLIEAVKVSNITDELAEKETLNFLMKYLEDIQRRFSASSSLRNSELNINRINKLLTKKNY